MPDPLRSPPASSCPPVAPNWRVAALDLGLIAVLVLVHLSVFAQAVLHTDLARDASVALMLLNEGQWPLLGPIMAGRLQLGPAWYYVLALLLAPGAGILGLQVGLGLLSALQFPLAYVCGRRLHSAASGRLWAVLLVLPAWSSFELIYPQHTTLTAPLLLGFAACALGYWRELRAHQLVAAALLASLAVHAHPSAAGLLIPTLALVGWATLHRRLSLSLAFVCGVAVLLPFAPMLVALGNGDADLLQALAGHYGSGEGEISLLSAPSLIWQTLAGGGAYLVEDLLSLGPTAAAGWQTVFALMLVLAALGLWHQRAEPSMRRATAILALSAVAMLLSALLLRAFHPYYMTTALRVALLGLLALGLSGFTRMFDRSSWRARGVLAVGLIAAVLPALALAASLRSLHAGAGLRFAVLPLFEVKQAALPSVDLPLQPLRRLDRQAGAVCRLAGAALHGPWAAITRNNYGLVLRLHCPTTMLIGGGDSGEQRHVAAVGGAMAHALDAPALTRAGGLGLFEVRRIVSATPPWPAITQAPLPYPPVAPATPLDGSEVLDIDAQGADFLLANRTGFVLDAHPEPELRCSKETRAPVARDGLASLWSLKGCADPQLELRGGAPAGLEALLL